MAKETRVTSYRLVPIVKENSKPRIDFEQRPSMTRAQIVALLKTGMATKSLQTKAVQLYAAVRKKVDIIPGEGRVAYRTPYLEVHIMM